MANAGWVRRGVAATAAIALCAIPSILDGIAISGRPSTGRRRSLSAQPARRQDLAEPEPPSVYPWARNHVKPLAKTPNPARETALFWHVHKSGGTTVKCIYECLGLVLANRAGVNRQDDEELAVFRPWPRFSEATYVNVDTTSRPGIDRAAGLGLVPSGIADLIVTSDPTYALERLFDEAHKGRVLAVFRHPIDRLVSKFYYLQTADWERQYNPLWKRMTVEEWADRENHDDDHLVKRLAGKGPYESATEADMHVAKRTIHRRFVVGLTEEMEESIRRFNVVMGVDGSHPRHGACMGEFFGNGARGANANPHPKIERGSPTWNILAERNALDIRLYEFIVWLFHHEQKGMIESYSRSISAWNGFGRKQQPSPERKAVLFADKRANIKMQKNA